MSGQSDPHDPTFGPFSFQGWDDQEHVLNPPVDFAEQRAAWCEGIAGEEEKQELLGSKSDADKYHAAAAWWRSLPNLPSRGYEPIDREQFQKADEYTDALLARAVVSRSALSSLFDLTEKLSAGLHALVVRKYPADAGLLLRNLSDAIKRFAVLAHHKPELFRETARHSIGIPGVVSLSKELTKAQDELLHLLEVGKNYPFRLSPPGKKGKTTSLQGTPANLWATRLFEYICTAIPRLEIWSGPSVPVWAAQARQLEAFDSESCESWFNVAWQVVLEATAGHPENEPALYVIGKSAYGRKLRAGSKQEHAGTRLGFVRDKIKDLLRRAFRQLAVDPREAKRPSRKSK